jgi:hypothetical protein
VKEFKIARQLGPATTFGKEASAFLVRLAGSGTKTTKR